MEELEGSDSNIAPDAGPLNENLPNENPHMNHMNRISTLVLNRGHYTQYEPARLYCKERFLERYFQGMLDIPFKETLRPELLTMKIIEELKIAMDKYETWSRTIEAFSQPQI